MACITVPIVDDNVAMEPDRNFIVVIDPPRGVDPPRRARVTVRDDDGEYAKDITTLARTKVQKIFHFFDYFCICSNSCLLGDT